MKMYALSQDTDQVAQIEVRLIHRIGALEDFVYCHQSACATSLRRKEPATINQCTDE